MNTQAPSAPVQLDLAEVSTITLNRPDKHNAMTVEMGLAIADAVERINAHAATRVVLVRGEGRAFCAGGDFSLIEANAKKTPEENRTGMFAFYRTFLSVLNLRMPAIAVLHGATVGAGLCLALACDLRIASHRAKLGANFVRVGLHPGMGGSLLLPRVIGPARAAELLLTGRVISGTEAERIGLVHAAVAADDLEARVAESVSEITRAAPSAVAQTKATLTAPLTAALDAALTREAECQAEDFASQDLAEAIAAFRAGRPPVFHGS